MSYKGTDIENKAVDDPAEQARVATIPAQFTQEYTKFVRFVDSETDADALGQAQVKFTALLRHMATLKVYVPPAWADQANRAGDKMSRIRIDEFRRRSQ